VNNAMSVLEASRARAAAASFLVRPPGIRALLAFWKDNKYPLLALNHGAEAEDILASPEFRAACDEENAVYDSLKAEYAAIKERWEKAGIRSLLIKSGGSYPSFPYTSDNLDVLVGPEVEATASAILRREGYIELKNIEEPRKFLFRKFSRGVSVSAIHLHTQVGWGVGFMDEKALWERSRSSPDDGFTVPSPEDIILINIAHSFYENKRFRLADIAKIRDQWSRSAIDWAYLERVAAQRGWLDGLHFCLGLVAHLEEATWGVSSVAPELRQSWEASVKRRPLIYRYFRKVLRRAPVTLPFNLSFVFSKYLYFKKILADRDFNPVRRLGDAVRTFIIGIKVKTRIRPQPSFLVSFSGPDGSGKSLHAETLVKTLDICEVNASYYWNRAATSPLARTFSTIIKSLKGSSMKDSKRGAAGRGERLRNPLLRFFWYYLTAADMALSYLLKVRLPMLFGRVVVCDRYVFDAAAEMECSLPPNDKINRLAIKMMLALSPKPDVAFLLDIPAQVCAERKSENTDTAFLERQRKAYLELAERYKLRIKKTDREFTEIADEVTHEVLTSYYRDYDTFIRGLFLSNPGQLNRHRKGVQ